MNNAESGIPEFEGLAESRRIDTTEGRPAYLLLGRNGNYMRVSESAYGLLQSIHQGMSFEELAEVLNQRRNAGTVTAADLEKAYSKVMEKLRSIDQQSVRSKLPGGFWFRWRIFPASVVSRLAGFLSFLYQPAIAVLLCLGVVAISIKTFVHAPAVDLSNTHFLAVYVLFFISLIAHEFGHAAACARFGGKPSDIGFTLYLIYPAFYSDVSSVWQLKRRHRVIVDLGGCYFQFVMGALFLTVTWMTGWVAPKIVFVSIFYTALFSLNPVFKFDGYWVLSDLLGVTNLSRQPTHVWKFLSGYMRGRPTPPLPWPPIITAILIIYSIASILVWSFFVWRLIPALMNALHILLQQSEAVMVQLFAAKLPSLQQAESLLAAVFLVVIFLNMGWQFSRNLLGGRLRRAFSSFRKENVPWATELDRP